MESKLSTLVFAFVLTILVESHTVTSDTNGVNAPVPASAPPLTPFPMPPSINSPSPAPSPKAKSRNKHRKIPPSPAPKPKSRNKEPRTSDRRIPPPSKEILNSGKKVGLLFAAMAAVLQVFVAALLIYKRRQLF